MPEPTVPGPRRRHPARLACDGSGLLATFRAATVHLEAHADEVNGLNVFPVPDGDTGTNMVATVRAALVAAEPLDGQPLDRVAAAIGLGALMGARGNSGVILSQVFRGMAETLQGRDRLTGPDLADALRAGAAASYAAVAKPVEGTILTVVRETADAATAAAADRSADLETVLARAAEAARMAVARTPEQLAILRDADVVDAGGQGFLRLVEGALRHVRGEAIMAVSATERAAVPGTRAPAVTTATVRDREGGFGYETMFLVRSTAGALDPASMRRELEAMGDSVLVAGDAGTVKVHVHGPRPDEVLAYGLRLGALSQVSVTNLDEQAVEAHEARAAAFAGAAWPPAGDGPAPSPKTATRPAGSEPAALPGAGPGTPLPPGGANGRRPSSVGGAADAAAAGPGLAVVAVAAGDGIAAIFREIGAAAVVHGGPSENPSVAELLLAVGAVSADEIVLLPNNPDVVLAASQVGSIVGRPIHVVETRNAAEGFAALLALDPSRPAAENAPAMLEAARGVRSIVVTEAVRDARIGGRPLRAGQTIALDPEEALLAVDDDPTAVVLAAIGALEPGFELVTVYHGRDVDAAAAAALGRRIAERFDGVEVEVVRGGQPHDRYLISAE